MVDRAISALVKRLKVSGQVWYWCACGTVALTHGPDEAPNLMVCKCGKYMILVDTDCLPYWPYYEFD